jgi:hypothetical protein
MSVSDRFDALDRKATEVHSYVTANHNWLISLGGQQAERARRRLVRGHPYFYWKPDVERLKRQGNYTEALDLVWECIEAAELDAVTLIPAPWWTTQAAIICRKLGYFATEVEVLERWIVTAGEAGECADSIYHRLESARSRLDDMSSALSS